MLIYRITHTPISPQEILTNPHNSPAIPSTSFPSKTKSALLKCMVCTLLHAFLFPVGIMNSISTRSPHLRLPLISTTPDSSCLLVKSRRSCALHRLAHPGPGPGSHPHLHPEIPITCMTTPCPQDEAQVPHKNWVCDLETSWSHLKETPLARSLILIRRSGHSPLP